MRRMYSSTELRKRVVRILGGLVLLVTCGVPAACSRYIDPNVPEPIRPFAEPEFASEYLLYRPSNYDREFNWPLVIVAHGGFPDSPHQRIRAWTQLAEAQGFLVAVPALASTRSGWLTDAATARQRLLEDERRILSVVRHVRAAYHVSPDRIFLHGHDKGAMVALWTGTNHADLFRAVATSSPVFDERALADAVDLVDHHQPVLVRYDISDGVTGGDAQRLTDWLRTRGANVEEDPHGAVIGEDTERVVEFFRDVLRAHPWIRVRALPTGAGNPLELRFKLRTTLQFVRYTWDFGDGARATSAEPVHAFAKPGTYRLLVDLEEEDGMRHLRAVTLKVPEAVIAHTAVEEDESPP